MSETVQLIATYGTGPVLLAFLLVGIWAIFKYFQKINTQQSEANAKQLQANLEAEKHLTELLDQVFVGLAQIGKNTTPKHSVAEEANNRNASLLVNQYLQKIREQTNCNRAGIFLYHNGGGTLLGQGFQKMSMMNECLDYNTPSVMGMYQTVPRMMFPILVTTLNDKGYYYIENMEDIKELDPVTYQSFHSREVKSAFIQSIKTSNHLVLGFVVIEFTTHPVGDLEEIHKVLLNKTLKITGILEAQGTEGIKKYDEGED